MILIQRQNLGLVAVELSPVVDDALANGLEVFDPVVSEVYKKLLESFGELGLSIPFVGP